MNTTTNPEQHINDALQLAELLRPTWPEISASISGVPTCHVAEGDLRERLRDVQAAVSECRNETAAARRNLDRARDAVARSKASPARASQTPEFKAAERARDEMTAAQDKLDKTREAESGILSMLGQQQHGHRGGRDRNGPRSGDTPGDGWAQAARSIDLSRGVDRVEMPLTDLLRGAPMAAGGGLTVTGSPAPTLIQPVAGLPLDTRGLFAFLPGEQLDPTVPNITDYKITSREVEGEITRAPTAVTAKAELLLGLKLATDELKQFSLFLPGLPVKLFDYVESLAEVLQGEMQKLLVQRLNLHIIEQIEAAEPSAGEASKATLLERLRAAVKAAREAGVAPSLLALNPAQAEELDLSSTGGEGLLVFSPRLTGAANGDVWGLTPVEIPGLETEPIVIDKSVLAKVFYGSGRLKVDEGTELDKNLVRLELSFEALANVRQPSGAFVTGGHEA